MEAKHPLDGQVQETPYRFPGSSHIKGVPGIGHQQPSLIGYQGVSCHKKAILLYEDSQVAGHMSRSGHNPGSTGADRLSVGQDALYPDRLHCRQCSHETAAGLLLVSRQAGLQSLRLDKAPGLLPALKPGSVIRGGSHLHLRPGTFEGGKAANMVPVMVGCHYSTQGCRTQPRLSQSGLKCGKLAREAAVHQQFSTNYNRVHCDFLAVPEIRK
jgi:hypothetical protein